MNGSIGLGNGAVVTLSGGVGGARLADGLLRCVGGDHLTVVVNTADDFEHYGLHISPDIDTVLYTLSGAADPDTGWGIAGDSGTVMSAVRSLGEDAWFQLGDRDLASHLVRTSWLNRGWRLTEVVRQLAQRLGVAATVLPMCDEPVRTRVTTADEEVAFQTWFVRQSCQPAAETVRYDGVDRAKPSGEVLKALRDASVIVIGPSNPYLSIGPIIALPGMVDLLRRVRAPIVALCPIVGGKALKGPTADMLQNMAGEASAAAVAGLYVDFLDGIVIDRSDHDLVGRIEDNGIGVLVTDTVMRDGGSRARLAAEIVAFAESLART